MKAVRCRTGLEPESLEQKHHTGMAMKHGEKQEWERRMANAGEHKVPRGITQHTAETKNKSIVMPCVCETRNLRRSGALQ